MTIGRSDGDSRGEGEPETADVDPSPMPPVVGSPAAQAPPAEGASEATAGDVPWLVAPPKDPTATGPELWTPSGIGWASVLLGYPGAVVLAALNWRRMDRTRKAIVHLAVAVIGTWVLVFLPTVRSVGLLAGIAVGYYLYRVQRSDQSSFSPAGRAAVRSGLAGAVLALVGTLVIVGSGVIVAVAVGAGETSDRGQVLLGTGAGTDTCSVTGQTVVFGPTDPIFMAAIMRETVQTGSHVVVEIDGPGGTVGPVDVTAPPPFDCFKPGSIGPFDPGTYVVRYRYADQPGTADLARGTFTIVAPGAAASGASQSATGGSPSSNSAALPAASPTPVPSSSAAVTTTASTCSLASSGVFPHQAPEIEAILPASVAGRPLTRWSVRGRCWLEQVFSNQAAIDPFVAQFKTSANPNPIDDTNLVYGIAGRSIETDPPFFVYAAVRPANNDEIGLVLALLFGGAGFHDIAGATDLSHYKAQTIAGKQVDVGTADMLTQDTHQRGRPYLYQTDQYMFLLITDQDAWAADAIGQLP